MLEITIVLVSTGLFETFLITLTTLRPSGGTVTVSQMTSIERIAHLRFKPSLDARS